MPLRAVPCVQIVGEQERVAEAYAALTDKPGGADAVMQDGNSTEMAASGFALPTKGNGATEGDGAAASNGNGAMAGDGGGAEPETPMVTNAGPRLTERKKVRRNKIKHVFHPSEGLS